MNRHRPRRGGMAAVMAMLYLVLFSALSIGFYATTTQSAQIVANDYKIMESHLAAESAVDFIRYQLNRLSISPATKDEELAETIADALYANLDGSPNFEHCDDAVELDEEAGVINIPGDSGKYVQLRQGKGPKFRVAIHVEAPKLRVLVTGRDSDDKIKRHVELKFGKTPHAAKIFDYGVVSAGRIYTGGSSTITGLSDPRKGSVLSTNTTDLTPINIQGKEVSGDVSLVSNNNISFGSTTRIGGTSDDEEIRAKHLFKNVTPPPFPIIDTSDFYDIVKNADGTERIYNPAIHGKTLDNMVIAPNTNPKFTGGAVIKGVMYVKTPNNIEFSGNTDIQGLIVVQNEPTGTITSNVLDFRGTVNSSSVTSLPSTDPKYDSVRSKTGTFILAPKFHVKFSGNFNTVNGSIMADKMSFTGNAGGTIKGTLVNLKNNEMTVNGSSDIVIASTDTSNVPTGIKFAEYYAPERGTYREPLPKELE